MHSFNRPREILEEGIKVGVFPAASVQVGSSKDVLWEESFGHLELDQSGRSATTDSVFDLASLTKVVATTTLVMRAVDEKVLLLDAPVKEFFSEWRGADRESVNIQDLLTHSSGLTSHMPFYADFNGRLEFEHAICRLPLEHKPGQSSIYSDLGFILLGFILEDLYETGLDELFSKLSRAFKWGDICFRPPLSWKTRTAPTEFEEWRGRLLRGEVHDQNAFALGGAAGHSGLFSSVKAVGRFAQTIALGFQGRNDLASYETFLRFASQADRQKSSRALGWDTMLPTSSCGSFFSDRSIGHTGFTGTSLWIDPKKDIYVALLTNRVCPTRTNEKLTALRPRFHNAVLEIFSV